MILHVYVSDRDAAILKAAAAELGRSVEDLAESGVSEAACSYAREQPPGWADALPQA